MPTERSLVGGGTTYDNTQVSSQYRPYYKFTTSDNFVWRNDVLGNISTPGSRFVYGGTNVNDSSYYVAANNIIDGTAKHKDYVNDLFTGVLPYQNPWDSYYKNSFTSLTASNKKAYFNFGLPVVITKYRMYNAFGQNVYGNKFDNSQMVEHDMADQTPQDWTLSGSNDQINWTTIDTRSSEARFPYATDRLAKNCSYSEYTVTGASAYKIYRLVITKGGRAGYYDKSGYHGNYYNNVFQIGEIQLWGYESPTTSCGLHGGYTLFPSAKCLNSSGTLLTETAGTAYKTGFPKVFSDFGIRTTSSDYYSPLRVIPPNGNEYFSPFYKYNTNFYSSWGPFNAAIGSIADTGYLDFGVAVTISSYNIRGPFAASAWTLYGSNDYSTWTSIDNRTGINSYNTLLNCAIASPASYRYYKMELKTSQLYSKSGQYSTQVNGLNFIGSVT
jgi:hypothetical protein